MMCFFFLGDTPLIAAARENHVDAVKMLLSRGAQVDIVNYDNMTAADHTSDIYIDKLLRSPKDTVCKSCPDIPPQL